MASESTKPEASSAAATNAPEQKNDAAAKPALGEDDEFEDFPVDGTSFSLPSSLVCL